jgi:hypothetical protein
MIADRRTVDLDTGKLLCLALAGVKWSFVYHRCPLSRR